tara:strand:+ start:613 stop:1035 length:423 start_codon:yes stop_codon:yes gene_type:complete
MEFDLNKYLNNNTNNITKNNNINNKANLVDNGVKYFFNGILKQCHIYKQNYYNLYYNFSMLILFCLILGLILLIKYKGNKNSKEKKEKELKDKYYIMSKLMFYNKQNIENNQRIKNNMITNLPDYNSHPEASLLHKKIYF